MGASGLGAMVASVYLASRKTVVGLGRVIAVATVLFGIAIGTAPITRRAATPAQGPSIESVVRP